jgi:hypothetical protein
MNSQRYFHRQPKVRYTPYQLFPFICSQVEAGYSSVTGYWCPVCKWVYGRYYPEEGERGPGQEITERAPGLR